MVLGAGEWTQGEAGFGTVLLPCLALGKGQGTVFCKCVLAASVADTQEIHPHHSGQLQTRACCIIATF